MRVLLIKPRFDNIFTKLSVIKVEPLELEYMMAICKSNSVEAKIYEGVNLKKVVLEFKPDIVAITANFVHIAVVKKYANIIKDIDEKIIVIVGGPHAEVVPEDFYSNSIDIVSYSGGFKPFELLVGNEAIDFSEIKGIHYRVNNDWIINAREHFDINKLPFPDRTYFYKNKSKYKYVYFNECAIVKASYSCPCSCNYCFSTLLNNGRYVFREPENLVEELDGINTECVWIVDDTFYVDKARVERFVELIKSREIKKKYALYYRADFIANNKEIIKKLYDIGVEMIAVGLEVIDDEVLSRYNKNINMNTTLKAIEVLKECNITCIALFMVDIDADKEYFSKLSNFIEKHNLCLSTIAIQTPMPGTEQYEKYKDRIITNDYSKWDFVHLTMNPGKMSRLEFYKEFYNIYLKLAKLNLKSKLLSPDYIKSSIALVNEFVSEWKEGTLEGTEHKK